MEKKTEITLLFGRSLAGKTVNVKKVLSRYKGSFVVWDYLYEYKTGMIIEDFNVFIKYVKNKIQFGEEIKAIVRLPSEYFNKVCYVVKETKNLLFIIEEIDLISSANFCPKYLEHLIRAGRHWNIQMIVTAKRPANVPRILTFQAKTLIVFKIREPGDLKYLQKYGSIDPEELRNLGEHESITKKL